jgi:metal-responsive CopG/Arc/MetJ family transcriptional regulator
LAVAVIYHIIIYCRVVAKKVAVSITVDGDVLRELDAYLREVQVAEIRAKRQLSTRSSLIEQIVRDGIRRKKPGQTRELL